jgi:methyl-accepting chemotaxis protein
MKTDNQAIADSVVKLNKRVQQIGKVVEFIHEIADKSDLLALNAELEGTKAGQVGRGFSLVAAEMRRLAESVILSTHEIEKLIEEIRDSANAAVMATEAGVKATDRGAALAHQVSESLRSILDLAASTSDSVRSISLATQQQQTGTDQLAEAMGGILKVTQQGTHATRQLLGANSDLLALSLELQSVVDRFRIEEEQKVSGGGAS